jgi:hypothetical protein
MASGPVYHRFRRHFLSYTVSGPASGVHFQAAVDRSSDGALDVRLFRGPSFQREVIWNAQGAASLP